jgi:hypothetical protein
VEEANPDLCIGKDSLDGVDLDVAFIDHEDLQQRDQRTSSRKALTCLRVETALFEDGQDLDQCRLALAAGERIGNGHALSGLILRGNMCDKCDFVAQNVSTLNSRQYVA